MTYLCHHLHLRGWQQCSQRQILLLDNVSRLQRKRNGLVAYFFVERKKSGYYYCSLCGPTPNAHYNVLLLSTHYSTTRLNIYEEGKTCSSSSSSSNSALLRVVTDDVLYVLSHCCLWYPYVAVNTLSVRRASHNRTEAKNVYHRNHQPF